MHHQEVIFLKNNELDKVVDLTSGQPLAAETVIIDVRSPEEYAAEHIAGSHNIPLDKFSETDFSPYQASTVIFHCRSGHRTSQARELLAMVNCQHSYCLAGGIEQWKSCGLPTQ